MSEAVRVYAEEAGAGMSNRQALTGDQRSGRIQKYQRDWHDGNRLCARMQGDDLRLAASP